MIERVTILKKNKSISMQINKMTFKTNISTDAAIDEVKSAFKAEKRIWSFNMEKTDDENLLHVSGEIELSEVAAKINSLGFKAIEVK